MCHIYLPRWYLKTLFFLQQIDKVCSPIWNKKFVFSMLGVMCCQFQSLLVTHDLIFFQGRGKNYVHKNLCTLENHEKANRILIISGIMTCEGSKFFPYIQYGILSPGSQEKIHNICINEIRKLHFVFADILDVWSYQKHEFWSWLW